MLSKAIVALALGAGIVVPAGPAAGGGADPPTFVVTTASDGEPGGCDAAGCTLREAITAANALPEDASSTIAFDVPGGVPVTIAPTRPLPPVVRSVAIDGTTQPGYAGTPVVEIDLADSGALYVVARDIFAMVVVRGLAVNRSPDDGIFVEDGSFTVDRSFLGTDVTGTLDRGNAGNGLSFGYNFPTGYVLDSVVSGNGGAGVAGTAGTVTVRGNRIGTDVTGTARLPNGGGGVSLGIVDGIVVGNVVAGNGGPGIVLSNDFYSEGPLVVGNLVGTDATGRRALGNRGDGIRVERGQVRIGTGDEPNVIGANRGNGIAVDDGTAVVVEGNRIGTDRSGTLALGNRLAGVSLRTGVPLFSLDAWVGGAAPNHIAFNGGAGIELGEHARETSLRANVLHHNGGLGIDLGADGVTANDPGDADGGANERQNFPVVTSATAAGGTRVTGTLDSLPSTSYRIDLYTSAACDASGYGEAERVLGTFVVTTDDAGHATFDRTFTRRSRAGHVVTATATGVDDRHEIATSELSACTSTVAAG